MPARYIYFNSAGSNVDISARVRAYRTQLKTNAEEGSVAISQLYVDDPEGGINIIGLKQINMTETSESSNQQGVYGGYIADRDVVRGPFRTEAARQWNVNLADVNSIASWRIMRGSDANRPAETDVQRVVWLLGTSEFGEHITNSRYVSSLFPVAMDAVDYRNQSNLQILDDCAQASGKNYFVFNDEPVNAIGLWYDYSGSSKRRSTIRLTNVLGLVDNDISFGISEDATLNRDPSRVYSGVVLPYVGGDTYQRHLATGTAFVNRDVMAPSVNVKSLAKAIARANRYLNDADTEADRITLSFDVPLAKVNHLMEGMAVQVWISHFPGYGTGWNWMRVLNRTVTSTSEEYYTITVELAAQVGGLDAGGGKTSEGLTIPQPPIVAPTPPQSCLANNGLTYSYTGGGTRTGLGPGVAGPDGNFAFTSTEFLHYWRVGGAANEYPLAGQVGDWGNGGICEGVFTSGGSDFTPGGANIVVRIVVVGPGTLTINTAVHPGGLAGSCGTTGSVTANVVRSGSTGTVVATDTKAAGTQLSVAVPNDGYCAHYVDINSVKPWGFTSATWTPA